MKKRIFIGSSSEEIETAKKVKALLSNEFEVIIWDENIWDKSVFRLNNNFLADLLSATLKFDFGILIGSPDDKLEFRGEEVMTARDNVIFELGLFIGRLGIDKCAFLIQEDVNIPSDLKGVKLCMFSKFNLHNKVEEIRNHFSNSLNTELNFFPSCTLATTYYENFAKYVCLSYVQNNGFEFNGVHYKKCKFRILRPNSLANNPNLQYQRLQNEVELKPISFKCEGRTRTVHVDAKIENDELILVDFPTNLLGINHAISNLLPDLFKRQGEEYNLILKRELNRYYDALVLLLRRNGDEDFVEFVSLDDY